MAHSNDSALNDSATDAATDQAVNLRPPALGRPAFWASLLLALQLVYLFYGIDLELHATSPGNRGLPLAMLRNSHSEVRAKLAGTLTWNPPDPEQDLYRQDAIATMNGAEAKVRFPDGTEITIEEGSLIIFEEPPARGLLDLGHPRPISARLLKGSIKKTHAGKSILLLKFSERPDAPPLKLEDSSGTSVFRVVYTKSGIQVVVESGMIRTSTAPEDSVHEPSTSPGGFDLRPGNNLSLTRDGDSLLPAKLPAPVLKQPKIEIQDKEEPAAVHSRRFTPFEVLTSAAWASNSKPIRKEISITFSWEPILSAHAYQVQISSDESFKAILLERNSSQTSYEYVTASPANDTTLYFRVAGIDHSGRVGEYSSTGKVEIHSQAKTAPDAITHEPKAAVAPSEQLKTPFAISSSTSEIIEAATHGPGKHMKLSDPKSAPVPPSLSPILPATTPLAAEPAASARIDIAPPTFQSEAAVGAAYHSRTLKNPDGLPRESQGSGFVPGRIRFELNRISASPNSWNIATGLSYLLEQANADLPATGINHVGIATIQAWLSLSQNQRSFQVGFGPYLGSSHRISLRDSKLESQLHWLGGALVRITPATQLATSWHWELRGAALGLGATGVDLAASVRRSLGEPFERTQAQRQGFFVGSEIQVRASSIENSNTLIIEVGYGF